MTVFGCCAYLYPDNGFDFDDIDKVLTCETCGRRWTLRFELSFDEETGEEDGWFWLGRWFEP